MAQIVIRNEDDLFHNLELAINGKIDSDAEIIFDNWPNYEITIRGQQFDGGVPTRVMPKLLDIQKEVRHVYSMCKYGDNRRLSREETEETELVIKFEAGRSTTFFSELFHILNKVLINMSPEYQAIIILGSVAILAVAWLTNSYIKQKTKVKLSEQETKRLKAVTNLVNTNPELQDIKEGLEQGQEKVLKTLRDTDMVVLDDEIVNGKTIKTALRKPRATAIQGRMDGEFSILSVDSGNVEEGFKMKVRNVETEIELLVKVPEGTLSPEELETLKNGEWGKKPVFMQINFKKLEDVIKDAVLIEAGLSEN